MILAFLKKFENQIRRTLSYPCVGDLVQIDLIESHEEEATRRVFGIQKETHIGVVVALYALDEIGKYSKDYAAILVNGNMKDFYIRDHKFKVVK